MDESKFVIKTNQFLRTLINVQESSGWNVLHDHQEWIIPIECIHAKLLEPQYHFWSFSKPNTAWNLVNTLVD